MHIQGNELSIVQFQKIPSVELRRVIIPKHLLKSNPPPNNFVEGVISNTIFNSANSLTDGGTRNLVMTIRNGGSGFDATFGGVRQLAFTDNDNMWLRGSGTGVTNWGSWGKVWTSLNDGVDSGDRKSVV